MKEDKEALSFVQGKSEQSQKLFLHFIAEYKKLAPVTFYPTKSMLGIAHGEKRIAWITQFGKNFIHVVFPFRQAYSDNLCFQKIAQVPGHTNQFNHHFRMLLTEDVNEEVIAFMKKILKGA